MYTLLSCEHKTCDKYEWSLRQCNAPQKKKKEKQTYNKYTLAPDKPNQFDQYKLSTDQLINHFELNVYE